ncbi:MAG: alkaline phosphatase [Acidobacteria bacterium]|nr:alkaline phosphatase [Acidobacteriota bacterium]
MKKIDIFARLVLIVALFCSVPLRAQVDEKVPPPFPVKRQENRAFWYADGKRAIERNKAVAGKIGRAKNVILFIGDGMGISTLTASRILEGQLRGESGEENRLSFEEFPNLALSKTYSVNQQTSDSAPTMAAIVTGVKTDEGALSVDQTVVRNDYRTVAASRVPTILEMAEERGLSTGVVSTARITHATPAACYAHTSNRDWESDAQLPADARKTGFPDIARQLIEFPVGDGLEVAIGGGRSKFLPKTTNDPEYSTKIGERLDGRDLTAEWGAKFKDSEYVWNKEGFDRIDAKKTKHLLGLFEPSHVNYEYDRPKDKGGEPSLTEMTSKAIDIVSKNKKGYFLMVEGGRIDHAHHEGNAFRALTETIELSNAVRAAVSKVDLKDTLIIVTADHSHTFLMAGYPTRGNNILGLVRSADEKGDPDSKYDKDADGRPYTTLGYQNGPGARKVTPRQQPDPEKVTDPDYKQEALVPLASETHGGEDVAIYAIGPGSNLVRGSMEQNWIFQVMREALRFPAP